MVAFPTREGLETPLNRALRAVREDRERQEKDGGRLRYTEPEWAQVLAGLLGRVCTAGMALADGDAWSAELRDKYGYALVMLAAAATAAVEQEIADEEKYALLRKVGRGAVFKD